MSLPMIIAAGAVVYLAMSLAAAVWIGLAIRQANLPTRRDHR